MNLAAAALRVEQSIERLLSRGAANSAVDRAADAITAALALSRFQRGFVSGGRFRNEPFGPTPRMPAEPLWPTHADAFAALAAECSATPHAGPAIDVLASSERMPVVPARADIAAARRTSARAELADLVSALEALQRQLLFEADCAESTDALNNSRQYLQAAGYLDHAAAELASLV